MAVQTMIDDALRYIGISRGKADEAMQKMIRETFDEIETLIQPKLTYGLFNIEKDHETVKLKNTTCTIKSNDLGKLLRHCERCIIMAATLGIKADLEISRRQKIDMLNAVVFDACCSVMIDKVCDEAEKELMEGLAKDEYLTMRFSPGYGDVPLASSRDILQVLSSEKRIGLSLTASDMLVPTKSITAIVGISSQKENRQKSCGRCNLVKTCMYRKRGDRCGL